MLNVRKQKGVLRISYKDITELTVNIPMPNTANFAPHEFNLETHMEWFKKGFSIELHPGISQAKLNVLSKNQTKNYNAMTTELNTLIDVMRSGVIILYKHDVQYLIEKNKSYTEKNYVDLSEKCQKAIYKTFKSRIYPMVKNREKVIEQMEEEYARISKPQKTIVSQKQLTKNANKSLQEKKRAQEEYNRKVAEIERLKKEEESQRRKRKTKKTIPKTTNNDTHMDYVEEANGEIIYYTRGYLRV